MKKKVSFIIPAYNEEECLPALEQEVTGFMDRLSDRYDFEVVLVDDGSKDRTPELLYDLNKRDARFNYVVLSRNFGKENALLAGMDTVTGDCVVVMDADLQHPIDTVEEMLSYWEKGYDDVYGKRLMRGKESWLRRKFSLAYYSMLKKVSDIDMLPNVGDFRLLDRRCINTLKGMRESQRYTKGLCCWIGYRKKAVEFCPHDSKRSQSSFNFRSLTRLALEGVTGFSTAPLRFASVAGMVLAVLALAYLVFILLKTAILGEAVRGFPTLICVILLLGGVQLLALGIIGEYLGRLFNESKHRPPYIIDIKNGERV